MWQAGKPDRMFLGRHDSWFYKHHNDTQISHMMRSDLENLIGSLDKKFLNYDKYNGLLGFKLWRKFYSIGPVSNFLPQNAIPSGQILDLGIAPAVTDIKGIEIF
jgi:hypothetical protein